jgi:hypothetical protein
VDVEKAPAPHLVQAEAPAPAPMIWHHDDVGSLDLQGSALASSKCSTREPGFDARVCIHFSAGVHGRAGTHSPVELWYDPAPHCVQAEAPAGGKQERSGGACADEIRHAQAAT